MHIRGTFQEVALVDLARFIAAARQTGVLRVFADPSGLVCFVDGDMDAAFRSHGSHRERLAAYATTSDPLEQRRVQRDRLAELIRLERSGASFYFEAKEIRRSGLPPLDLDELTAPRADMVGSSTAWEASRRAPLPDLPPLPTEPPSVPVGVALAAPVPAASVPVAIAPNTVVPNTVVPNPSVPTRQLARAERHQRSRSGALARLIGVVRYRQGAS